MVIVIYVVIGGFSWKHLKWLAQEIVRLQVSDYSQLSDYRLFNINIREQYHKILNEYQYLIKSKKTIYRTKTIRKYWHKLWSPSNRFSTRKWDKWLHFHT